MKQYGVGQNKGQLPATSGRSQATALRQDAVQRERPSALVRGKETVASRDETASRVADLIAALDERPEEYSFYIPGWAAQGSEVAIRWMESTLWEGFYVAHLLDRDAKTVRFKVWEYEQDEPAW